MRRRWRLPMIDIHSHVLPGLDDGARSSDEAVAMVRIAAQAGTTDLVATPHANLDYKFEREVVEAKLAELGAACHHEVRLHYGCDFHFYFDNIQNALERPEDYTIAHKRYLLVEFPDVLIPNNTGEVFERMLERGITPIVTHPERNYLLHARVQQIERWVQAGVLMQVTAQSFSSRFGREVRSFTGELMRRGLVHFVASDAHDPEDRTPRLDGAFNHVLRKYGREWADALFLTNPGCVIHGEPLREQPPAPKRRRWYHFGSS